MNNFLFPVISRPTVDFLDALASASGTFAPPYAGTAINNLLGVPKVNSYRFRIRAIEYIAVEQVGLEFDFFGTAAGLTNVVATDTFLSRYPFSSVNGAQYAGAGLFRFYVDGLDIPYVDLDSVNGASVTPALHVGIQNVDTVAKSANAAGAVQATFWLEPVQGW